MNKKIVIIAWICVVFWMAVIFYLSSQPSVQSAHLSNGISDKLVICLGHFIPGMDNLELKSLNFYVRKNAHFLAYFILSCLLLVALTKSRVKKAPLMAFAIALLYAISDEIHQLFVSGRSCQLRDVGIDAVGAAAGILILIITARILAGKIRI